MGSVGIPLLRLASSTKPSIHMTWRTLSSSLLTKNKLNKEILNNGVPLHERNLSDAAYGNLSHALISNRQSYCKLLCRHFNSKNLYCVRHQYQGILMNGTSAFAKLHECLASQSSSHSINTFHTSSNSDTTYSHSSSSINGTLNKAETIEQVLEVIHQGLEQNEVLPSEIPLIFMQLKTIMIENIRQEMPWLEKSDVNITRNHIKEFIIRGENDKVFKKLHDNKTFQMLKECTLKEVDNLTLKEIADCLNPLFYLGILASDPVSVKLTSNLFDLQTEVSSFMDLYEIFKALRSKLGYCNTMTRTRLIGRKFQSLFEEMSTVTEEQLFVMLAIMQGTNFTQDFTECLSTWILTVFQDQAHVVSLRVANTLLTTLLYGVSLKNPAVTKAMMYCRDHVREMNEHQFKGYCRCLKTCASKGESRLYSVNDRIEELLSGPLSLLQMTYLIEAWDKMNVNLHKTVCIAFYAKLSDTHPYYSLHVYSLCTHLSSAMPTQFKYEGSNILQQFVAQIHDRIFPYLHQQIQFHVENWDTYPLSLMLNRFKRGGMPWKLTLYTAFRQNRYVSERVCLLLRMLLVTESLPQDIHQDALAVIANCRMVELMLILQQFRMGNVLLSSKQTESLLMVICGRLREMSSAKYVPFMKHQDDLITSRRKLFTSLVHVVLQLRLRHSEIAESLTLYVLSTGSGLQFLLKCLAVLNCVPKKGDRLLLCKMFEEQFDRIPFQDQIDCLKRFCTLGIFPENVINKTFSQSYLETIKDLKSKPKVKANLMSINRAVALQRFQLDIPWHFGCYSAQDFVSGGTNSFNKQSKPKWLIQSCLTLLADSSSYFEADHCSPYLHTVDYLFLLNKEKALVECSKTNVENARSLQLQRVCIQFLQEHSVCSDGTPIGPEMAKKRELEIQGYQYVQVKLRDFMDQKTHRGRAAYLRDLILNA